MGSAIRKADWTRAPWMKVAPDSFRPRANLPESWVEGPLISFSEMAHAYGARCESRTLFDAKAVEGQTDGTTGGDEVETAAAASTRLRGGVFSWPGPTRRIDGRTQ